MARVTLLRQDIARTVRRANLPHFQKMLVSIAHSMRHRLTRLLNEGALVCAYPRNNAMSQAKADLHDVLRSIERGLRPSGRDRRPTLGRPMQASHDAVMAFASYNY